ncbi:hypothetical protein DIPPA_14200 [Diplonema papillatum]|nr:hypothetical protein DIPPA_14200 [Diplonema papillatum]
MSEAEMDVGELLGKEMPVDAEDARTKANRMLSEAGIDPKSAMTEAEAKIKAEEILRNFLSQRSSQAPAPGFDGLSNFGSEQSSRHGTNFGQETPQADGPSARASRTPLPFEPQRSQVSRRSSLRAPDAESACDIPQLSRRPSKMSGVRTPSEATPRLQQASRASSIAPVQSEGKSPSCASEPESGKNLAVQTPLQEQLEQLREEPPEPAAEVEQPMPALERGFAAEMAEDVSPIMPVEGKKKKKSAVKKKSAKKTQRASSAAPRHSSIAGRAANNKSRDLSRADSEESTGDFREPEPQAAAKRGSTAGSAMSMQSYFRQQQAIQKQALQQHALQYAHVSSPHPPTPNPFPQQVDQMQRLHSQQKASIQRQVEQQLKGNGLSPGPLRVPGSPRYLSTSPLMEDAAAIEACWRQTDNPLIRNALMLGSCVEAGTHASTSPPRTLKAGQRSGVDEDVMRELVTARNVAESLKHKVHEQQAEIRVLRDKMRLLGEACERDGQDALVIVLGHLAEAERAVATLRARVSDREELIKSLTSSCSPNSEQSKTIAGLQAHLEELQHRNDVLLSENRTLKEAESRSALGLEAQKRLQELQRENELLTAKNQEKSKSIKDLEKLLRLHLNLRGTAAESRTLQFASGQSLPLGAARMLPPERMM